MIDRTKGGAGAEDTNLSLNLNAQVAKETQPADADEKNTLDRVFLNDLVAVDADRGGRNFLFVSRGGNYVLRAGLDAHGQAQHPRRRRAAEGASACRPATCRRAS